jgi:hypothetical protein
VLDVLKPYLVDTELHIPLLLHVGGFFVVTTPDIPVTQKFLLDLSVSLTFLNTYVASQCLSDICGAYSDGACHFFLFHVQFLLFAVAMKDGFYPDLQVYLKPYRGSLVAEALAGQKSHSCSCHSRNLSCLNFPYYVYHLMQASRNLADGYSAAKALVSDATGCKLDFHHLMLLNVQYIS